MTDTDVDFLLENLMQLINCDNELILVEKDQIESLYEELGFLRKFLKDSEEKRYEHEKVKNLVAKITDAAYKAEDMVDWFILNAVMLKDRSFAEEIGYIFAPSLRLDVDGVMEEIKSIKTEVMEIYEKKMYDFGVLQIGRSSHSHGASSSRVNNPIVEQESLVGVDDDTRTMIELLTIEQEKQLKVIPIVGMAGLGKTTLARKVYNDPFIVYHFYTRAWIDVSQVYEKRDLLLSILNSAQIQLKGKIEETSNENLGEKLYRGLKGKKYLAVMDDIWNIGAWEDLKIYFPNDNNGSRIIFTSRLVDVVPLHAKPHYMPFLSEDESWNLLRHKAFPKASCPPELMEIGKQIAKKCRGLPLAILVIAGLLAKKDKTQDLWRHVAKRVSSYIVTDPEQYMDTLALSYNHLPNHLKACFLYLGAFPEDYEIPAWQLICLWVAEGFIRLNEQKSLEEVAEDYLMDLIDRSLVVVSKTRSNGGIKTCRIHDLLRDLCLRKCHEENFLQQISRYEKVASSSSSITIDQRRVCIHPAFVKLLSSNSFELQVRSFSSFARLSREYFWKHLPFISQALKLLRVLNLSYIDITASFHKIKQLVHLRYIKFHANGLDLSPASQLWNLETLIVEGSARIKLQDIFKMGKLRHLYVSKFIKIPIPFVLGDGYPYMLNNLQTIRYLPLSEGDEEVFARIPNLRKLKCRLYSKYWFPELDFLIHLKTLSVSYSSLINGRVRFPSQDKFPPNLKKLTLSGQFGLPWAETSTLGRLPNLEVLKLLNSVFEGPRWETSDGEFLKLKFLKLQLLDIEQWNASSNHFPNLWRLVLDRCYKLKEVPSGLGDIPTLELIELQWPTDAAANSARQIQEEQRCNGNDELKILIYPPRVSFTSPYGRHSKARKTDDHRG